MQTVKGVGGAQGAKSKQKEMSSSKDPSDPMRTFSHQIDQGSASRKLFGNNQS